ncbi:hypothetical protein GQR36_22645 [Enterococcus termitis]
MENEKELEITMCENSKLLKLSGTGHIFYNDSNKIIDEQLVVGSNNKKVLVQSVSKFKFLIIVEK